MFTKFNKDKTLFNDMPVHLGIILDGNGRWAKKRHLPRKLGHKEGSNNLKIIAKECNRIGIKYLTLYSFSTENWSRPKKEVEGLMDLLRGFLDNSEKEIAENNMSFMTIGRKDRLAKDIVIKIEDVVNKTKDNSGTKLIIALDYGSRDEIVNMVKNVSKEVVNGTLRIDDINEKIVEDNLYTKGIPSPDLIIRPSGEKRLSNFLLWQSAYAEFWFSNVLWPDFTIKHLHKAIEDYSKRDRRYGGTINNEKND